MIETLDWSVLASRAATIDERLSGRYEPTGDAGWETEAEASLRLWMEAATHGDAGWFTRRLERDGLTLDTVKPLMGPVRPVEGADLPGWAGTAKRLMAAILDEDGPEPPALVADVVPFAHLFWPTVASARARRGEADPDTITSEALDALDRALIERMAQVYGLTVLESFDFFRSAEPEPLKGAPPDRGIYAAFIAALREGPLLNLIDARPVMIRLLAVIVEQWIEASREFLERLSMDSDRFAEMFPELADAGSVVALETGISDPHNHGRSVVILTFGNGGRLVYKPRPLDVEAAWFGLSAWCAEQDCPVRLGAAPAWLRGDYGWMGFVTGTKSLQAGAAPAFYRDVGGLLAIMLWIQGGDLHHENILVRDGVPVPVDLETVLNPNLRRVKASEVPLRAEKSAQCILDTSVLRAGLLPNRRRVAGRIVEVGGLASQRVETVRDWQFTVVNRDAMKGEFVETERSIAGLPINVEGKPAQISEFADVVVGGFRDTVAFLHANRAPLLAPEGPMAAFETARIRHVPRSTAYYETMRRAVNTPKNQSDGIAWSRHFERLGRNMRWDLDDDPGWALLAAERAALARYDIPMLTGIGAVDGCWADGVSVEPNPLEPAVWPSLDKRLDTLLADVNNQVRIAEQAMRGEGDASPPPEPRDWSEGATVLDPAAARAMAFDIAGHLAGLAVRRDGGAAWIGAEASEDGKAVEARVLPDSLYGGNAGNALFLAACFRCGGDAVWRTLALEALAAPRHRIATGAPMGIGGFDGLGGVVYALTRAARLLDAPELLDDARRAAARIDRVALAQDRVLDVVGGAAGAALGLLALYGEIRDPAVLDRAAACGHHIPALPIGDGSDCRDWRGVAGRPLAGFAHGAAGMVYALLRLHEATGEVSFLETARRGLAFERSLFDPAKGNWPDLRKKDTIGYPIQWCHGASGIGLGRLATVHVLDTPDIRADIDAAIAATLARRDAGRDHLCCGNAGRLAVLGAAARILGHEQLKGTVDARMAAWMERAGDLSGFRLVGVDPALRLGLLQGLAGVGQALLEQTNPDSIQPVLALA